MHNMQSILIIFVFIDQKKKKKRGTYSTLGYGAIWNAILLCLMWLLWRERNRRAFEDTEHHTVELKMILIWALHDWMTALLGHSYQPVLDFIDSCCP